MLSVIMPVYQAEKYLETSIESVLNQTLRDLELLLVDDGSTDRSPAICDAYAQKDPRVRVIHKKNSGVAGARNAGLDAACGEWIMWLDSDDILHPAIAETLLSLAAEKQLSAVWCSFLNMSPDGVPVYTDQFPSMEAIDKTLSSKSFSFTAMNWQEAASCAGDGPSALHLILPEAYLDHTDTGEIDTIHRTMERYLKDGVFDVLLLPEVCDVLAVTKDNTSVSSSVSMKNAVVVVPLPLCTVAVHIDNGALTASEI